MVQQHVFNPIKNELKKTELCTEWLHGHCTRTPDKCAFAHGRQELQPKQRHPKEKTQLCKNYYTPGEYCRYGKRCRFIHHLDERVDKQTEIWMDLPDDIMYEWRNLITKQMLS